MFQGLSAKQPVQVLDTEIRPEAEQSCHQSDLMGTSAESQNFKELDESHLLWNLVLNRDLSFKLSWDESAPSVLHFD